MTFSFTGLSYLFLFFTLGVLIYRFFQYWRREKIVLSKLFICFASTFALFALITAIAGLFFAKNSQILKGVVVGDVFLQGLVCAIIGYMIIYIKFPKISPWFGFWAVFLLGLTTTILTILIPFEPSFDPSGAINWDVEKFPTYILRSILFLITFLPLAIIHFQQFIASEDFYVKTKALGLALIFLLVLVIGSLDFFLENILKLGAISSDIGLLILSLILLIVILLTQKLPPAEKKYIPTPTYPKIPW